MAYTKTVQIATYGLIPEIYKRGPIAEIELAADQINRLADRGVIILDYPSGAPILHIDEKTGEIQNDQVNVATGPEEEVKGDVKVLKDHVGFKDKIVVPPPAVKVVETPDMKVPEPEPPAAVPNDDAKIEEDLRDGEGGSVEIEEAEDEGEEAPATPADPSNPYAGMSKNQIKKAKRAEAQKAAEAAQAALRGELPPKEASKAE